MLHREELKAFVVISWTMQGCTHSPCLFNIALEDLAWTMLSVEKIKGIHTENNDIKVSSFHIIYLSVHEFLKDSNRNNYSWWTYSVK